MVGLALSFSFGTNVILLILKLYVAIQTGSVTLLAAAADSMLDIFSGAVLFITERIAHQPFDPMKFPEGRTRIEPIGVIVFATIMFMSSLQILVEAIEMLAQGEQELVIDAVAYTIIAITVASKTALMIYCRGVLAAVGDNGPVEAYATDHMMDVIVNTGSALFVFLASSVDGMWWMDALGAGLIAIYIMAVSREREGETDRERERGRGTARCCASRVASHRALSAPPVSSAPQQTTGGGWSEGFDRRHTSPPSRTGLTRARARSNSSQGTQPTSRSSRL